MKSFLEEFRKFALRGNAIDLAIGVVLGAAFNNITNSLVTDVLTPPLGFLVGDIDFSHLVIPLGTSAVVRYGAFIQTLINFVIVAFALFLLVKVLNRLQTVALRKQEEEQKTAPVKSAELLVLEEIRDALSKKG